MRLQCPILELKKQTNLMKSDKNLIFVRKFRIFERTKFFDRGFRNLEEEPCSSIHFCLFVKGRYQFSHRYRNIFLKNSIYLNMCYHNCVNHI